MGKMTLACGCLLGSERCLDCRPGLHANQEIAAMVGKMTSKERNLFEWLQRSSPLLESQIVASGLGRALNTLLLHGLADMGAHPTVRERGVPAAAVFLCLWTRGPQ